MRVFAVLYEAWRADQGETANTYVVEIALI